MTNLCKTRTADANTTAAVNRTAESASEQVAAATAERILAGTTAATSNHVRQYTSAPVKPADAGDVQPEFVRVTDTRRLFGFGRTTTYNLAEAGLIRTILLRRPGQKSGMRLVDCASVREYLRGQTTTSATD